MCICMCIYIYIYIYIYVGPGPAPSATQSRRPWARSGAAPRQHITLPRYSILTHYIISCDVTISFYQLIYHIDII